MLGLARGMAYLASQPPWHIQPGRRAHRGWGEVSLSKKLKRGEMCPYLNTRKS